MIVKRTQRGIQYHEPICRSRLQSGASVGPPARSGRSGLDQSRLGLA